MPRSDLHRFVQVPPTALEEFVEERAIDAERDGRGERLPAWATRECLLGCCIMSLSDRSEITADVGKRGLRQHPARYGGENAVGM